MGYDLNQEPPNKWMLSEYKNTRANRNGDGEKSLINSRKKKMVARIEAYLPNKLKEPTIAIESPKNYYQTIATKQNSKKKEEEKDEINKIEEVLLDFE